VKVPALSIEFKRFFHRLAYRIKGNTLTLAPLEGGAWGTGGVQVER